MPTQASISPSSSVLKGTKILVVDDEKDTVGLAKLVLETSGAEIFCAFDGEELWNGLQEERWGPLDLILLDLKMPRMDGLEVCTKLKRDARFKRIPILVFTAKISKLDREKALAAGADAYITKPFLAKNLSPKIRDMISSSKSGE